MIVYEEQFSLSKLTHPSLHVILYQKRRVSGCCVAHLYITPVQS